MFREHDRVILTCDMPEDHLQAGDVGTIIHVYENQRAFEVELLTLDGNTAAIVTLLASQVRPVGKGEIAHARAFAVA